MIADKAIAGFNPSQLADALHLGIKGISRDPSEMIPLIERALEAVERAVRQMPDEKLNWTAPNRNRPMCEFAYHIFMVVQNIMKGFSIGIAFPEFDLTGRSYTSFQDIAEHGRTVIDQYRDWASKQDLDALRKPPLAGSDAQSGAKRLDFLVGHTIQHLRQLYALLETFGITPENRVPDSEWPSEYVLVNLW
ncbi:DinB family protein [Chloroflexota bacterium]